MAAISVAEGKNLFREPSERAKMPNEFIIFAAPRTGSYALASRLDSAADIVCHGELFKSNRIEISQYHANKLKNWTMVRRDADALGFIRELRALNPYRHFGFKAFLPHLSSAKGLRAYVHHPERYRVLLHRNPLEVYASSLRARSTGAWVHRSEVAKPLHGPEFKVHYTPETFDVFRIHYNAFLAKIADLNSLPNTFVIDYSTINDPGHIQALLAFVGSTTHALDTSSEYVRQYGGTLEESFDNWGELQDALAGGDVFLEPPPPSPPIPLPLAQPEPPAPPESTRRPWHARLSRKLVRGIRSIMPERTPRPGDR